MKNRIYADNAATTKLDTQVLEAMLPYLTEEYGNASSLYSFTRKSKIALKESRTRIAKCIGAQPEEIYFTSGGTESDNWAIKGTAFKLKSIGRHIITTQIEHHAVLNSCEFLEMQGFEVTYLPVDNEGLISENDLLGAIREDTILISIMHTNNEIGTIQNIKALSKIAHENKILFHCDAVQSIGHIPIDIVELGIDILSASAHKFNGPKGVGFLYMKQNVDICKYASGGFQEHGMRAGTENVAGVVGMAEALVLSCNAIEKHTKLLSDLSNEFLATLNRMHIDYKLNGSKHRLPGNINISIKGADGEALLHRLDLKGICVSTGSACNSENIELSHVIKAINTPIDYAYGTIRISFGKDNTLLDVASICNELKNILTK